MKAEILRQVQALSLDEQIALVGEIHDVIADQGGSLPLTGEQQLELERRLADYMAHPGETTGWDEVKAAALASLRA